MQHSTDTQQQSTAGQNELQGLVQMAVTLANQLDSLKPGSGSVPPTEDGLAQGGAVGDEQTVMSPQNIEEPEEEFVPPGLPELSPESAVLLQECIDIVAGIAYHESPAQLRTLRLLLKDRALRQIPMRFSVAETSQWLLVFLVLGWCLFDVTGKPEFMSKTYAIFAPIIGAILTILVQEYAPYKIKRRLPSMFSGFLLALSAAIYLMMQFLPPTPPKA